jgi:hypothetical protein
MQNIWLLLLIFLFVSCVTAVEVDLPEHESLIVVNSYLVNNDSVKVHISNSAKQTNNLQTYLLNAEVILKTDQLLDTLVFKRDGWYHSSIVAKAGKAYNLEVNAKGFKNVTANEILPLPVNFKLENYIARVGINEFGVFYSSIDIVIDDDCNAVNYYEIECRNHKQVRRLDNGIFSSGVWSDTPEIVEEIQTGEGAHYLVFSDEKFKTPKIRVNVQYCYSNNIDSVSIIVRAVSFDYYRYKKSLIKHTRGQINDDLWGGYGNYPLYVNIENGYGIFAGYSETVIPYYTYTELKP